MKANQAVHDVRTLCRTLDVSASGFYAWCDRLPSARAIADEQRLKRIRAFHAISKGTYGVPRIFMDLAEEGTRVGRKRIARLMRSAGLRGVSRRKGCGTTIRDREARPAPDLVQRKFVADAPRVSRHNLGTPASA